MLYSTTTELNVDSPITDGDVAEMAEFVVATRGDQIHVGEFSVLDPPEDCGSIDAVRGLNDGRVLLVGTTQFSVRGILPSSTRAGSTRSHSRCGASCPRPRELEALAPKIERLTRVHLYQPLREP